MQATYGKNVFTRDLNESYQCDAEQKYTLTADVNTTFTITLETTEWRVQAFAFKDSKSGAFDKGRYITCTRLT